MLKYRINRETYWCGCLIYGSLSAIAWPHLPLEAGMIALGIPRLHDIGKSGLLVGYWIALEVVVLITVGLVYGSVDAVLIAAGLIAWVTVCLGIWLGLIKADGNPNKWGQPRPSGVRFGAPKPKR